MVARPAYHFSMFGMLARCSLQFYWRYIMGYVEPPGIAARVGSGVHESAKYNLDNKIKRGSLMQLEDVLEIAARTTRNLCEMEGVLLSEEEETQGLKAVIGEGVDKAVRLARVHHSELAPRFKPIAVEHRIRLDLSLCNVAFDLEGTCDLLDNHDDGIVRGELLWDFKTSGKSYSADSIVGNPQTVLYSMMREHETGVRPVGNGLGVLVDTKVPKSQALLSRLPTVEEASREQLYESTIDRIVRAAHVVDSGAFMPADKTGPSGWVCSQAYCGYWKHVCPHGKRSQTLFAGLKP